MQQYFLHICINPATNTFNFSGDLMFRNENWGPRV